MVEGQDVWSEHSLDYTRSWSKLSCVREMYFVHVTLAYLTVFAGIGCFLTRLDFFAKYKPWHLWFGRAYVLFMVWNIATSLLIHNTGLPFPILVAFVWTLTGMTVGWIVIKLHQANLRTKVIENVGEKLMKPGAKIEGSLGEMLKKETGSVCKKKTFSQRLFSYKSLHGIVMSISWYNLAGRIPFSNQSGDFQCYTFPAYKGIPGNKEHPYDPNNPIVLVPIEDDDYARLPWGTPVLKWVFSLHGLFLPMFVAMTVAYFYIKKNAPPDGTESPKDDDGDDIKTASTKAVTIEVS